ncbi:hypothetical protein BDC45DRAFT_505409, partial [Circinella umbellata]
RLPVKFIYCTRYHHFFAVSVFLLSLYSTFFLLLLYTPKKECVPSFVFYFSWPFYVYPTLLWELAGILMSIKNKNMELQKPIL